MFPNLLYRNQSSLASNSFYLYLSHFADYLLALFLLPFIARTIGAIEFGIIGLSQTFGILITLLMEFGSSLMATREVSRKKDNNDALKIFIGQVTTFKLLLIPIAVLISIIVIGIVPIFTNKSIYVFLVLLGSIFQGISPTWYFQGIEKMKKIALSKIIFRLISFGIVIFYVKSPNDGWMIIASFSFSSALICLYLYYIIIKKLGLINLGYIRQSVDIFGKSINSFFITIVPLIYQNICIIMLSIIVNPIQLGLYYGASKIYRAFNNLYGPLSQAFFPIISSLGYKNKIETKILLKNYLLLIFFIGILFFSINFFFAERITLLLLGGEFSPSSGLLKIFAIVLPLTAISNALGRQFLMAINKDFFYTITQLLSSLIGLIIFIYLIRSQDLGAKALPISLIFYELTSIIIISIFLIKNDIS